MSNSAVVDVNKAPFRADINGLRAFSFFAHLPYQKRFLRPFVQSSPDFQVITSRTGVGQKPIIAFADAIFELKSKCA